MHIQLMVGGASGEPGSRVLYHVVVVLECPVGHVVTLRQHLEELIVKGAKCVLDHATKRDVLVNEPFHYTL